MEAVEQTIHCLAVRFQSAIGVDMRDIDPSLVKCLGDQKRPVAFERLPLCTQEYDAVINCAVSDATQATLKRLRSCDAIVPDAPVLIAGGVIGAPAQFMTEICILNTTLLKTATKRVAIELRIEATVRRGADIGYGRDTVHAKEREEGIHCVVGMADGKNRVVGSVHNVLPILPE